MEDQEMKDVPIFYCPKCGQRSLRQLNAKEFVCEREHCQFTAYKNTAAAVAAIIVLNDDKIIMTRRGKEPVKGKLDLPGGFVDADETLEKSLEREVKEELSLRIRDLSYLGSFPNKYPCKGIEYSTVDSVFVCKPDSPSQRMLDTFVVALIILLPMPLLMDSVNTDLTCRRVPYPAERLR
jgi:ADP-ribose pyrophosphatase YjhB (NUDIX family)